MVEQLPDAPTEEDTDRNGVFSYAGEVHAFVVGFGVGFAAVAPVPRLRRFVWTAVGLEDDATMTDALREARSESWYALGGIAFGAFTALSICLAVGLGVIRAW